MKDQDENDELTFQLLGLAAEQLTEKLSANQREHAPEGENDPAKKEKPVSDPEQRDRYIDRGLQQIRQFERRYDPKNRPRRKNRNL